MSTVRSEECVERGSVPVKVTEVPVTVKEDIKISGHAVNIAVSKEDGSAFANIDVSLTSDVKLQVWSFHMSKYFFSLTTFHSIILGRLSLKKAMNGSILLKLALTELLRFVYHRGNMLLNQCTIKKKSDSLSHRHNRQLR